ncbi:hypothetical protein QR685DRAFT_520446 [Neurospora intermedia]|uniref:Secreted protein n=1 Tax=Neurospora intermedia TaxID=5142 RepID=A0ABR3DHP0_NEUIN
MFVCCLWIFAVVVQLALAHRSCLDVQCPWLICFSLLRFRRLLFILHLSDSRPFNPQFPFPCRTSRQFQIAG